MILAHVSTRPQQNASTSMIHAGASQAASQVPVLAVSVLAASVLKANHLHRRTNHLSPLQVCLPARTSLQPVEICEHVLCIGVDGTQRGVHREAGREGGRHLHRHTGGSLGPSLGQYSTIHIL